MLYKNLPEEELRKVMRWRWWLDYLAAFQTLFVNGNWGDFKAIFKARRAFKKWKHLFKDDRNRIQAARKTDDSHKLRAPFSIVWQYHAKGKKTFSQLFS